MMRPCHCSASASEDVRARQCRGVDSIVAKRKLTTVQEWVASPRRRAALRERLADGWTFAEMSKAGGVVIRPGASYAALIAGAASHLAFATAAPGGVDGVQRAVAAALERLVLATSREQVASVVVAGIAEAALPSTAQPSRRRRR